MTKPLSTKETMIVAAERCFALDGLKGASMRQIAIEAGQRNESAAHYHFGSQEGLIRAILGYRLPALNARREKWLEEAKRSEGKVIAPRTIVSIIVLPMAEEIFANWRSCYWVRFLSQLWAIDKYRHLGQEFVPRSPAFHEANSMLRTIPGIEPRVLQVRAEILRRDVVWGLSSVEAMSFHERREVCELHIANLVDMITASISVPPSDETLRKVENLDTPSASPPDGAVNPC